jgi:hypothetical protein
LEIFSGKERFEQKKATLTLALKNFEEGLIKEKNGKGILRLKLDSKEKSCSKLE